MIAATRHRYVVTDPAILSGEPIIEGTRRLLSRLPDPSSAVTQGGRGGGEIRRIVSCDTYRRRLAPTIGRIGGHT